MWSALVDLSPELAHRLGVLEAIPILYTRYRELQTRTIDFLASLEFPGRETVPGVFFVYSDDPRETNKLVSWCSSRPYIVQGMPHGSDPDEVGREFLGLIQRATSTRDYYNNPGPAEGTDFFGRDQTLGGLVRDLTGGVVTGVFGLRKVGKTSVVKELGRQAKTFSRQQVFVFYDLETLPDDLFEAVNQLCRGLAQRFHSQLKALGLRTHEVAALVSKGEGGAFITPAELHLALNAVLSHSDSQETNFLLALDEVESLIRPPASEDLSVPVVAQFLGTVRSLVQEHPNFNAIISGVTAAPMRQDLVYGRENPLFAWAKPTYLGPWPESESQQMITILGARMGLKWTPQATKKVHELTSSYPSLCRSLASAVRSAALEESPTSSEVEITELSVTDVFTQWRRQNGELVDMMLGALDRYYSTESECLELFLAGTDSWADIDDAYPTAVGNLISLGVLSDSNDELRLSNWVHLSPRVRASRGGK